MLLRVRHKDEAFKTEAQLDNWIRTQLTGSTQVLTRNLLHDQYTMPHDLYTFISTSYEDTMYSSKFDSAQAWKLTSSFVKQIFTAIGCARVSARYAINIDSPWSSGAGIIFATLFSNSVMREFMCLSIKYHPSISSEMVCYSIPSTNTSELITRISEVYSFQRSDQIHSSKQEGILKKLDSFKTKAEKSIKKLKEKSGI